MIELSDGGLVYSVFEYTAGRVSHLRLQQQRILA